jgi:hypothetical protein
LFNDKVIIILFIDWKYNTKSNQIYK